MKNLIPTLRSNIVLSMTEYGRKPKVRHINMTLWPMVLPWQAPLHKLPMEVVEKSDTPFNNTSFSKYNIIDMQ
jgi:hypothetical protein